MTASRQNTTLLGYGMLKRLAREPTPPEVLYHYTGPVALQGIVESRSLWATRIDYLNDRREFHIALDESLALLASKTTSDTLRKLADYVRDKFEGLVPRKDVYVVSLSARADLLSQWRAYAPDSGGYSIGFRTADLVKGHAERFYFGRCVYRKTERAELLLQLLTSAVENAEQADERTGGVVGAGLELVTAVFFLSPFFKHDSFEEEAEWRIAVMPMHLAGYRPVRFRAAAGNLVPYVHLPLAAEGTPLPIQSVYVGPNREQDLAAQSLRMFLHGAGLTACEVHRSETSYRGR
jgi:hypothetical protein